MTRRPSMVSATKDSSSDDDDIRDLLNDIKEPDEDELRPLKDPPAILAEMMVAKAFDADTSLLDAVRTPSSATIIEVPSADWINVIAEMWVRHLWGQDAFGSDGDSMKRIFPPRHGSSGNSLTAWCEFRRDGEGKTSRTQGNAGVAWAISQGIPLYGFSQNPRRELPSDLLRVAERTVRIPLPDTAMVAKLAELLCGTKPSESLPDELCRLISIGDIWLALRPEQSADDYILRLRRILGGGAKRDKQLTLDDVGGMREAAEWGRSLARDIADYKAGIISWQDVDPGVLVYGRPGTGKTTFARALAGSCKIPLVTGSLSEWQSRGHLGDLLKAMRATFAAAKAAAPAILFIDEIDAFGAREGAGDRDNTEYRIQVINGLLEEMDGAGGREGVVIVGACNHPHRLDPALVRSGRLDRAIEIPLPNAQDLEKIMRLHLGSELAGVDLSQAARNLRGGTGADAQRCVRGAKRRARMQRRTLELGDLIAEIGVPEIEQVSRQVLWGTAVHEAGHAVAACMERPGKLMKVSIKRDNLISGFTMLAPEEDPTSISREEMERTIRILLAGRAAEEAVLDEITSGAGGSVYSDLAKATLLVATASANFGLSSSADLTWLGEVTPENLTQILAAHPALARETSATLAKCYENILERMKARASVVRKVAALLVEREAVDGREIEKLVRGEIARAEGSGSRKARSKAKSEHFEGPA